MTARKRSDRGVVRWEPLTAREAEALDTLGLTHSRAARGLGYTMPNERATESQHRAARAEAWVKGELLWNVASVVRSTGSVAE